ncbi:MAG: TonB-dependent receptor plug domain-containing protein, partial [Bacteroidota bacterium]
MRKLIILFTVGVCCVLQAAAQQRQIQGIVEDAASHNPLPLATITIQVKGALNSTKLTDSKGQFTLTVAAGATLTVSYTGYKSRQIPVPADSGLITVLLEKSASSLDDIVVIGYGKQRRADLTSAISSISSKDINELPVTNLASALASRAPGVEVHSNGYAPGSGNSVNVRGLNSITQSEGPLYIVDGVAITGDIRDINPNDIESVEVLKDASAAAIYGARAGNGVVLITTKKGKAGQKTVIELNTSRSISNPARKWKFLDAKQYIRMMRQGAVNDGTYDQSSYPSLEAAIDDYWTNVYKPILDQYSLGTKWQDTAVNSNWQKELFHHNAPSSQINLSATGGNDKTRFFISGFYNLQDAIVINNKFSRYGARFNIDHTASDRLTFGLNLAVDRSQL